MPKVTVLGRSTAGTKIQVFYPEVQKAMVGRTASQRKESFQIGCWLGVVDYSGKDHLPSPCESTGTIAASRRQKRTKRLKIPLFLEGREFYAQEYHFSYQEKRKNSKGRRKESSRYKH